MKIRILYSDLMNTWDMFFFKRYQLRYLLLILLTQKSKLLIHGAAFVQLSKVRRSCQYQHPPQKMP